jgi:predicted transposase/invertase (TIGR01784 family)
VPGSRRREHWFPLRHAQWAISFPGNRSCTLAETFRVPTPHDALFKHVFSQPEHAASELLAVFPRELSARVDWTTLKVESGTFVDPDLTDRHTDLLFTVRCSGHGAFVYVLFEHQSRSEQLMAFRLLEYMVRIWGAFRRDHPEADRLPAIIPVVLHHSGSGESAWTAPTALADIIDLDPNTLGVVAAFIPQFRFLLDDLPAADDEALRRRSLLSAMTLFLLQHGRSSPDLLAALQRWADVLAGIAAAPNGVAALAALLEYAFKVGDVPPEGLRRLVHQLGPVAEEAYMTTAQQLTEQVREEALARGKAEGKAEIVIRLLALRFGPLPETVSVRLRAAGPELLDVWAERVLTATSLDDALR